MTINIGTIDRKRSVETYKRGRRFVKTAEGVLTKSVKRQKARDIIEGVETG